MLRKQHKSLIAGLDIGTTKVVVLVGEATDEHNINIVGMGTHPSRGLKRGIVVNIEATMQSIQRALEEAELTAGCQIHQAYTGIAGSHIQSLNSHGVVPIRNQVVTQEDIDRVIEAAKAVAIPANQKVLHILPQEFIIDQQAGIREPIGMSGVRLESKVHLVTGAVNAAQNIIKCVQACNLQVENVVLEQLASSFAVLTEDERELGICLVDIGGGTTDIAVFVDGAICYTAVIPIAGDQVTHDIAVALRTPARHAEAIKLEHACVQSDRVDERESIQVPGGVAEHSPREVSKRLLARVIEARYEELFGLVMAELRRSGIAELMTAGLVLTGGASRVSGARELAERVFKVPVRSGVPRHATGITPALKSPIYATSVGLLLYGHQRRASTRGASGSLGMDTSVRGVWQRMRRWFQGTL